MTVASRIAVMEKGELVQVATPGDIYENPKTRYIAGFIGDVNVFEGTVAAFADGCIEIDAKDGYRFKTAQLRARDGRTAGMAGAQAGKNTHRLTISLRAPSTPFPARSKTSAISDRFRTITSAPHPENA